MNAHKLLICAMIEQTVKDIRYTGTVFALRKQKESARRWVLGLSDSVLRFDFCCDMANLEPDSVKDKLASEGNLRWRPVRRKRRAA